MKMKKILLIFLSITMCVSMCACAEPITKDELIGNWKYNNNDVIISITFTEQNTVGYAYVKTAPTNKGDNTYDVTDYESSGGNYTLENNVVSISFNEGTQFGYSCEAKYSNGKLKLGKYYLEKE